MVETEAQSAKKAPSTGTSGPHNGRNRKRKKKRPEPGQYIKVARVGKVSVYRRGSSYWIYFRDSGKSIRKKIDGNLATAKATASQINVHLEQKQPSPFNLQTKPVAKVVQDFLEHCKLARGLRIRSLKRYRAALDHFLDFISSKPHLCNIDQVKETTVDEFVRYLHDKKRVRSGEKTGPKEKYTPSGIAFILSTCRTLFNYARKRRLLSPYEDNPFSTFPIDKLRNREPSSIKLLASEQLSDFFSACDDWQFSVFFILSLYGLRAGELTHLLISDVDLPGEQFFIRPKPCMQWYVKSNRQRVLPIIPEVRPIFEKLIDARQEGFLFLSRLHVEGRRENCQFASWVELEGYIADQLGGFKPDSSIESDEKLFNLTKQVLHKLGKIREDNIRKEFMQVVGKIGRPEVTTVHSLRHLFATLAEENGLNPLTVQTILGHSRIEMTRYYTHTGLEAKKGAVQCFLNGKGQLDRILTRRLVKSDDSVEKGGISRRFANS